jgi:hypothetical protein
MSFPVSFLAVLLTVSIFFFSFCKRNGTYMFSTRKFRHLTACLFTETLLKETCTKHLCVEKTCSRGPGSSAGIATGYGLDDPGIKTRWGRDFSHLSIPALGSIQPPVQWVPGLSRGRKRPRRDNDPSLPSSAEVLKQSIAIPLLSLRAFVACKEGETYLKTYCQLTT